MGIKILALLPVKTRFIQILLSFDEKSSKRKNFQDFFQLSRSFLRIGFGFGFCGTDALHHGLPSCSSK